MTPPLMEPADASLPRMLSIANAGLPRINLISFRLYELREYYEFHWEWIDPQDGQEYACKDLVDKLEADSLALEPSWTSVNNAGLVFFLKMRMPVRLAQGTTGFVQREKVICQFILCFRRLFGVDPNEEMQTLFEELYGIPVRLAVQEGSGLLDFNLPGRRRWRSSNDARVRPDHRMGQGVAPAYVTQRHMEQYFDRFSGENQPDPPPPLAPPNDKLPTWKPKG